MIIKNLKIEPKINQKKFNFGDLFFIYLKKENIEIKNVGAGGIEPPTRGLKVHCSTNWAKRPQNILLQWYGKTIDEILNYYDFFFNFSSTAFGTNFDTSPFNELISFISFEDINWYLSEDIKNTVSILGSNL